MKVQIFVLKLGMHIITEVVGNKWKRPLGIQFNPKDNMVIFGPISPFANFESMDPINGREILYKCDPKDDIKEAYIEKSKEIFDGERRLIQVVNPAQANSMLSKVK